MLEKLGKLSRICTTPHPGVGEVERACEVVRTALAAEEAYIIRAGDPHFICLGCDDDPTTYEIKQKGYWLIWQDLAAKPEVPAGIFDVVDRLVHPGQPVAPGKKGTHVASILPGDESNSELLLIRGPWPDGLTAEQAEFVVAARPMLAYLICNVLDDQRQARQREQLSALADVSKAFNEAREMDKVLTSVATALAEASGFDWVTITTLNDTLDEVVDRAMNLARHSGTETAGIVRQGGLRQMVGNRRPAMMQELIKTGKPLLIPDVLGPIFESMPQLQAYFERAHILSVAMFPIVFQQKTLGTITFASSTKRTFEPLEVDFLTALVTQAATTIKGLRLCHDLEQSKEELRQYAEKLEETGRVEHLLARTDALTGLPNRRYIEEAMEAECARAARYDQPVCVVMADLDYFKQINDGYGHQTGDDALKFVASLARQACRTADLVSRWGGDEFVFILPSATLEDANHFAERFRQALASTAFTHPKLKKPAHMTISLGVAQAGPDTFANAGLLLERADKALYAAKAAGRNCTMLADGEAAHAA